MKWKTMRRQSENLVGICYLLPAVRRNRYSMMTQGSGLVLKSERLSESRSTMGLYSMLLLGKQMDVRLRSSSCSRWLLLLIYRSYLYTSL
jgi:hypothetical protein